jgi:hypothetical protein
MAISVRFTAFSDAQYFLNQLKGLPETITGLEHRNRCVTTCILLSWVGLEEAAADESLRIRKAGYSGTIPGKLRGRLEFLLARKHESLDAQQFQILRTLRNKFTHPETALSQPPDQAAASASFDYCTSIVRSFYAFSIHF